MVVTERHAAHVLSQAEVPDRLEVGGQPAEKSDASAAKITRHERPAGI